MGEIRKPCLKMLLNIPGKEGRNENIKIELFDAALWGWEKHYCDCNGRGKYRIRINGKWNDLVAEGYPRYATLYEFRDILFRTICAGMDK